MDVRLPDGTIIKNVPEGTTKADLVGRLQRNGMAVPADWLDAKPVKAQERIDATDGMSTTEKVLAGAGKAFADIGRGAKQALDAPAAALESLLNPSGSISTALGMPTARQSKAQTQADIDEAKRLDAPLLNTRAGTFGNVVGRVATGLPAVFIPGANTFAGAGLIGAGQGALEPTADGESTLGNIAIGGAAGMGGVAVGRALKAGYGAVKGLIEPFLESGQQKIAGRVLERFASDPNAVRSASSQATVTGARPMLSEASKDPGIAALERALAQQDPQVSSLIGQRAADNNAARVATLQAIAGDDAKRAAAEAARSKMAGEMYDTATNATYTVDGKLADLLKRPAVQQAVKRAEQMAANQGREFSLYAKPDPLKYTPIEPPPTTLQGMLKEEARRMAIEGQNTGAFSGVGGAKYEPVKKLTGQGLQDLKMAMDEMLTDPTSGFTGKAGDTIKSLRGQIMDWMESANPAFKDARTAYAAASKPINEMDIGQRLLEKGGPAIRGMEGEKRLTANAFARLLDDEQALARKATGFKGVNALSDAMTPENLSKVQAIRNELELASNLAASANGPGSQTAKSLASQNLLRQIMGPTGLPQSWAESTLLQSLMRPAQFAMKVPEERLQNTLAQIMLDPSKAGRALDAAKVRELSPLLQTLLPYVQQAGQQSAPASALVSRQR